MRTQRAPVSIFVILFEGEGGGEDIEEKKYLGNAKKSNKNCRRVNPKTGPPGTRGYNRPRAATRPAVEEFTSAREDKRSCKIIINKTITIKNTQKKKKKLTFIDKAFSLGLFYYCFLYVKHERAARIK